MTRAISYCVSLIVNVTIVLVIAGQLFSQSVSYDCPAVAPAKVLQLSSTNQVVEVVVPVSVSSLDTKLNLNEVKVDVAWNRNAYPIVDYAPRTQLHSRYDGSVSIEKKTETSYGIGASTSSSYFEFLSPNLKADVGKKNSESRRYNEIPEQQLLVASGTAKRGTGAFFSFKDSRIGTLQGDREIVLAFDVPLSWRGGILQVTINSIGRRKKFAAFYDDFEFARVFMLPIFVDGDEEARRIAYQFARSEQRLRRDWELFSGRNSGSFAFANTKDAPVPNLWAHQLIQSGSDSLMMRYERRLPKQISATASEFVTSRHDLLALSH